MTMRSDRAARPDLACDGVGLTFPDVPRPELDQVAERAPAVAGVEGRLRGLLLANRVVAGDLDLPAVLRHTVDAARELLGARYAAVGVVGPGGRLVEFVHAGMSADEVRGIGDPPQGTGLIGAMRDAPEPIRLCHVADDARSSGFPVGHPPMDSFLGVPIRVRDGAAGSLYLGESIHGSFSVEDEELAQAFAANAGVAIDNARAFDAARIRHAWLEASAAITRRLLSAEGCRDGPLELIAEHSREIADADLVTIALPDADGDLRTVVAVGNGADGLPAAALPPQGPAAGTVFATGTPLRVDGPATATDDEADGPTLMMPLLGPQRTHGVLTAARRPGRPAFTAEDLDMAAGFAAHAAIALELAEARAEQQRAAMLDDRERIAADLHDHVIQRLFATGLSLQSVAATLGPGPGTDRVLGTVRDLDDTISQIRTTIFDLHRVSATAPVGVRARVLAVIADVAPAMAFRPAVLFSGLLEGVLDDDVVADLLAVLREALTNVARHAHAHTGEVRLTAGPDRLTLEVTDDGVGVAPAGRRSGIANLARRAEHRGGTLRLCPREPRGTRLSWSVPHG
jgi:signal transduction histidine kinase